MKLDLSKDHRITLKRHGKKLWSYRDQKPDVVEAAVLDYLRDHGFDGYFTQRENYLSLFMRLAGWPGRIFKRFPPGFVNPHYVYYSGPDGVLPSHRFPFSRVMAEVEKTTLVGLSNKLRSFCTDKPYVRQAFSASNKQPDHMLEFLQAFGVERLKTEIKLEFTEERLKAQRYLLHVEEQVRNLWKRRHEVLHATGLKQYSTSRSWIEGPGFRIGHIQAVEWSEDFVHYIIDPAIKAELLEACEFARNWREKLLSGYDVTTLDLQLWDETGTAIVEVKAPNDKLSQAQKNTIELARTRGERACVINVSEANQPR